MTFVADQASGVLPSGRIAFRTGGAAPASAFVSGVSTS